MNSSSPPRSSQGSAPGTPKRTPSFFGADFGQKIDLCARLREILINYPSGTTILKEFVQNADDAGASTIRFCLDERTFPTESLADESLAEFQGPSMLVYNTAKFSDEDFASIQRVGDSLKKEKLAQIGKFGIGFNSCYHLTELPSFVSRTSLVMFDPQAKFIPDINPSNPGKIVDILDEEVQDHYPDQLAPFKAFGLDFSQEFEGTLFRLPLRTAEQAETSRLSVQVHTTEALLDLLVAFKADAQNCLLFLKNVTCIEAMHWRRDQDKPANLWACCVANVSPELTALRSEIPAMVVEAQRAAKETKQLDYTATESDYEVHIQVETFDSKSTEAASTHTNKWAVCASCQGSAGRAGKLACDPGSFALRLVPWAGVATLFESSAHEAPEAVAGLPFCFLPLPAATGLPVHVHGFFEMSSNRRDIWKGDDLAGEGLIRVEWNKALLESVVAPTYARMLVRLSRMASPEKLAGFYAVWPSEAVADPWVLAVRELYAAAGTLPLLYSPVGGGQWVCPQNAKYVPEELPFAAELQEALLEAGQAVVQVPAGLRRTLAAFALPLADVTPAWVREQLTAHGQAPAVVRADRECGVRLLEYCLSDMREGSARYSLLQGLPLVPMADGLWRAFGAPGEGEALLLGTAEELVILEAARGQLVDPRVPAGVGQHLRSPAMALHTNVQVLSASRVSELLGSALPEGWEGLGEVDWTPGREGHPTEEWMRGFWKYAGERREVAAFQGWPLLPSLEGSLCKLSEEESVVIDGATVFSLGIGRILHSLGCRVLNFDLVPSTDAVAPYVQPASPHGVLSALRNAAGGSMEAVCARVGEASGMESEKRELRAFLMARQWMAHGACSREDAASIRALPIHAVHQSAALVPITTQQLAPAGATPELLTEDYLRVDAESAEAYALLGVQTSTLAGWYEAGVLSRLRSLDARLGEEAVLEMLRRLPQLCAEDAGFLQRLRDTPFVASCTGALARPCDLYDPNAPGLKALLADETRLYPADAFLSPELVATLVRLGLRTSLDREGVIEAAGSVEERMCEQMMLVMVPIVQRSAAAVDVAPAAQLHGSV